MSSKMALADRILAAKGTLAGAAARKAAILASHGVVQ